MTVRSLNWLKFGGLVGLAFMLGLLFAGLLDLPSSSLAQNPKPSDPRAIPASSAQPRSPGSAATAPLVALSDAFASVAEQVRPSVVYIRSRRTERDGERKVPQGLEEFFGTPRLPHPNRGAGAEPPVETGAGSGFIVSADGYILTNNHVVDGADQVTVRLLDRHEYTAKVIGTDPNTDLAVIKIEPRAGVQLTPAALGASATTRVGEWVLAVGNPLSESLSFTVTSGIVSAKGRGQLQLPGRSNLSIQDYLQTDAAINRGNSGGPLLNVRGEVIGINSAIYSPTGVSAGYAFAIPIDLARQVMNQLISKGKVERAALGVVVGEVTALDAEWAGLSDIYGVKISEFAEGSPAKAAGLQQGDLVVTIDGQKVEYVAQLQQNVGFKKPGDVVKVEVARKAGVRRTYSVRLIAQSQAPQLASNAEGKEAEPATPEVGVSEMKERLGITVTGLTADIIQQVGLPASTRGVIIESVDPYGPADGLLSSQGLNLITAFEGKPIRTEAEIRTAVKATRASEIVTLTVLVPTQDGKPVTQIVRIKLK